jgi:hypothetical protein
MNDERTQAEKDAMLAHYERIIARNERLLDEVSDQAVAAEINEDDLRAENKRLIDKNQVLIEQRNYAEEKMRYWHRRYDEEVGRGPANQARFKMARKYSQALLVIEKLRQEILMFDELEE